MTNATLRGKPHVRFDEGEVASAKPRRGSLLYKKNTWYRIGALVAAITANVARASWTADTGAKKLSDSAFSINYTYVNQSSSPQTVQLNAIATAPSSPSALDLRTIEADTCLRVVSINGKWSGKNIAELWFPDTVSSLNDFQCDTPTNALVLPAELTSIGTCFKKRSFTGDLVIPSKVTSIADYAFESGKFTSIDLSRATSLTKIGTEAFKLCTAVTNTVTIPANVQELAASALSFAGKLVGNAAVMPLSGDIKI